MKLNAKEIITPAAILTAICIVVAGLLGLTNSLTEDKIAEVQLQKAAESRSVVLPEAESFEEADGYYVGLKGGETVGYVFETSGQGYGGAVKVMTGIAVDDEIKGIAILDQNETPGLGGNCVKETFQAQFAQKAITITVVKNQEAKDGEIEALTGATITSRAVTSAVNSAVDVYNEIKEGE